MKESWDAPGLRVERNGPIARFVLERPEAMNALSPGLVRALNRALDEFATDPSMRVLVLTGTGRAFCCGADLKFFAAHRPDSAEIVSFLRELNRFVDALDNLDRPVIGAANGRTMGGGLELLLTCDLVLAADHVTISDPHITIAAIHGAGGSQRLVRSVGLQRALDLVLTARSLSAQEAADWGLVSRVVPKAELDTAAAALAEEIAERDDSVTKGLKRLVRLSTSAGLDHGLAAEREAFAEAARRPPFVEAMQTFAKRT